MHFSDVIDLLREKQGFSSHEQAADFIGLSRGGYFKMLRGDACPKDATIHKIMEGSGLDAPRIEAAWKADFSKDKVVKRSWERFLSTAASIALAAPALLAALPEHCILC